MMVVLSYARAYKSRTSAGVPVTVVVKDCVAVRLLGFVTVTEIVAEPGPAGVMVTTPAVDTATVAAELLLDATV